MRVFIGLILVAGTVWPGCESNPVPGVATIEPVYIITTELLAPPIVGLAKSYRPEYALNIRSEDPAAGQAVGFFMTIAATRPELLRARLRDPHAGTKTDLIRIDLPAAPVSDEPITQLAILASASADTLAAGQPVFSVLADGNINSPAGRRVAFLVPVDLLRAIRTLECYISSTAEGGSLAGDRIELVPDFFYLAVVGDSILWGNGLNHRDKFTTLTAEWIEAVTGKRVITQTWAITGARIVPSDADGICGFYCFGEAPRLRTSITGQADLMQEPESLDLVIMDGCINDVGIGTILDPDTPAETLVAVTEEYCGQEMSSLLDKVRRLAPRAAIVVIGYFPIVSLESDLFGIRDLAQLMGEQVDENDSEAISAYIEKMAANSTIFYETSSMNLAAAVDDLNAAYSGTPPAVFVDPRFGPANAVFGPEKWLWSLTTSNAFLSDLLGDVLKFFPEDSTLLTRVYVCLREAVADNVFQCLYVSVGHPNPDGARAYARGIIEALEAIGILPEY
ncbi:MAG: hypothetical protein GXY44_01335 [Phycisphaerales bacterium]|nr:hypothetical protein [Phycisphaerales bacterium]